ncbi:MAG TPA: copper homeostasis membrane protein CopD [Pseudolabrys sp.]
MIDPLIITRGIHMAATVLAAGTVTFLALMPRPAFGPAKLPADFSILRRQLTWLTWGALAVAILSGVAWLMLLAADIYGASIVQVCLHGGIWPVLSDTRFGLVSLIRLALALLLAGLMFSPSLRLLQMVAAICLLALIALIGHAGATPGTAGDIHLASDIVHLLAAGAWVGALPGLALLLAHTQRSNDTDWGSYAVAVTRRFSSIGVVCVGALLASGIINSWNLLGGPRDLVTTDYGRLIFLKIVLFVAMVGIATANRFHFTPLLPAPAALKALQRNALAETGLALCVLLFVGALGTMSPSSHAHSTNTAVPPDAAFVHIHTNEAMAEVTLTPGRVGQANATIRVLRDDFSEYPAKDVQLALEASDSGAKFLRNAAHLPDGTWQVNAVDLTQAGVWTVRVTVTPQAGAPIVLDAPIEIDQ